MEIIKSREPVQPKELGDDIEVVVFRDGPIGTDGEPALIPGITFGRVIRSDTVCLAQLSDGSIVRENEFDLYFPKEQTNRVNKRVLLYPITQNIGLDRIEIEEGTIVRDDVGGAAGSTIIITKKGEILLSNERNFSLIDN